MSPASASINQIEILARSIDQTETAMSPEVARYFLELQLAEADRGILNNLAEKSRQGALTASEQGELDEYRRVGRLVELMKVKAQAALRN